MYKGVCVCVCVGGGGGEGVGVAWLIDFIFSKIFPENETSSPLKPVIRIENNLASTKIAETN